jgi:selenocysteine lyase/cysteine desulfurase
MRCLGVSATARASLGVYNDESDIEALISALMAGREVFGL